MLFRDKVLKVVSTIPSGKTMTYKEVAAKAGNPDAARAVGSILSKNYRADVPCHRVIKSTGALGGYNRVRALNTSYLGKRGLFRVFGPLGASQS